MAYTPAASTGTIAFGQSENLYRSENGMLDSLPTFTRSWLRAAWLRALICRLLAMAAQVRNMARHRKVGSAPKLRGTVAAVVVLLHKFPEGTISHLLNVFFAIDVQAVVLLELADDFHQLFLVTLVVFVKDGFHVRVLDLRDPMHDPA